MLAMLTVFALIASYFIASGLSRTQVEVNAGRNLHSLQSMQQAKAALIAFAASQAWGTNGANDQPGALPCPAADDLGQAGGSCSATPSTRVGRFPWKTIGAPDLRDSSGQILWYAVDAKFHQLNGVHATVINSDIQATMTVTGIAPASNVVALIIAPGDALSGQDRSVTTNIANYLESNNATGADTYVTAQSSDTFNDRVVVITQADLMAVVEPAVAARIERDVKPYLQTYLTQWGAFAFPAMFSSATYSSGPGASGTATTPTPLRPQSSYVGDSTQSSGLLPLTPSASYGWTTGTGTVTLTGGTAQSISVTSCAKYLTTYWRCDFTITSLNSTATCGASTRYCMVNPSFRVAGGIGSNAGISFASLPTASTVTITSTTSSTARAMSSTAISGSLTAGGVGTVNFDGTHGYSKYSSSSFTRTMRVTIPEVVASSLTGSADPIAGWFIKNEWYRQTYYAVSGDPAAVVAANRGLLPGGVGACGGSGATCLTVNHLPSSYTVANDKKAILIFAGRALTGSRPSSYAADGSHFAAYFEDVNLTTAKTPTNRIYTHTFGSASTVNDRAIVLSP